MAGANPAGASEILAADLISCRHRIKLVMATSSRMTCSGDALRYVDGLDDVAFLAMDLKRLGRADLSEQFFADYAEFSADPAPISLRHHYVAYRVWVRVLVNSLRAEQGDADALDLATLYAQLTLRHCGPPRYGWCSSVVCQPAVNQRLPRNLPTPRVRCFCPAIGSARSLPVSSQR